MKIRKISIKRKLLKFNLNKYSKFVIFIFTIQAFAMLVIKPMFLGKFLSLIDIYIVLATGSVILLLGWWIAICSVINIASHHLMEEYKVNYNLFYVFYFYTLYIASMNVKIW
jgi:hypothetical protein